MSDSIEKETTFTPGPWVCIEVRTSCGRAFRIGKGEMIEGGPSGGCIIYDDYGHGKNERESNARLIAAAPELYEALRAIVNYEANPDFTKWTGVIERAADALARARGEDRSHEGKSRNDHADDCGIRTLGICDCGEWL